MKLTATIGITIDENEHLSLPRARGALRIHTQMDTRLLTIRLVPGFDDGVLRHLIETSTAGDSLKVLVLQLYGTGNAPSVKKSFVQLLADAVDKGVMVVANTQCHTGSVLLGKLILYNIAIEVHPLLVLEPNVVFLISSRFL